MMERFAAGGAVRSVGRKLLMHLGLAWTGLQLLLYQSAMLADVPLRDAPVETALQRAGVEVEGADLTLLWQHPPEPAPPGSATEFLLLEGRAHRWMATLGRSLGIPRWRVLERREGAPYLLGLGGQSARGVRVEVWLYGADAPPAGLPAAQRGGMAVRFSVDGVPAWEERLLTEWLPALPGEWTAPGNRPAVLVRWRLRGEGLAAEEAVERLAGVLAARVRARNRDGPRHEAWLASPRGGVLPPWAVGSPPPPGANVYVLWYGPQAAGGSRAELIMVPSPLSALGRAVTRVWGGAGVAAGV